MDNIVEDQTHPENTLPPDAVIPETPVAERIIELDAGGYFIGDFIAFPGEAKPSRWTRDFPPNGLFKGRYVEPANLGGDTGEWSEGVWVDEGAPSPEELEAAFVENLKRQFEIALQTRLDTAAVTAGYDSINTAVSYAEEPAVPRFQNDGKAFRAWRSLSWDYAYTLLGLVQQGQRPIPTVAEFLEAAPKLELPA